MAAGMDHMESLLREADGRFEDKLRLCQQGVPSNLNMYTDRSYSIRQQVSHNPQLLQDEHFASMLTDTESYLSQEYLLRGGETDRRLTAMLAGLLKTLLRDVVNQPLFSVRKIQIEMIWQWYQSKRNRILDFAIDVASSSGGAQQQQPSPQQQAAPQAGQVTSSVATTMRLARPSTANAALGRGSSNHHTNGGNSASSSLQATSIGQQPSQSGAAAAASSEFEQDYHRDMEGPTSSSNVRVVMRMPKGAAAGTAGGWSAATQQRLVEELHPPSVAASPSTITTATTTQQRLGSTVVVPPLTYHDDAIRSSDTAAIAKKSCLYKTRNLAKAEKLRQELGPASSSTSGAVPAATGDSSGGGPRVVYSKDAKARQRQKQEARTALVNFRHGPSGPSTFLHHAGAAPTFQRETTQTDTTGQAYVIRHLTKQMGAEDDAKRLTDVRALFAANQARVTEETHRRLESEQMSSVAGMHAVLRRRPATASQAGRTSGGNNSVTTITTTTTASDVLRDATVAYRGPLHSVSPFDDHQRPPAKLDEQRLQSFLSKYRNHIATAAVLSESTSSAAAAAPKCVRGEVVLDVVLAPEAKVSTLGPRLDVPIVEQIYRLAASNDAAAAESQDVPSLQRLSQLKLANRVRDACAFEQQQQQQQPAPSQSGPSGASQQTATHGGQSSTSGRSGTTANRGFLKDAMAPKRPLSACISRRRAEMAVVTPADTTLEDCLQLLPTYGLFLPRNPGGPFGAPRPQSAKR